MYNKEEHCVMSYDRSYIAGKITALTVFLGVAVLLVGVIVELPHSGQFARASSATTSVTVLNTPPLWPGTGTNANDAQEHLGSSTSTPTNSGSSVTWKALATDSSGDNYYLLICSALASATPNNSAAPTCGAGRTLGVSASTVSGTVATVSTTTYDGDATEFFNWYAYVCDFNINSQCNWYAETGSGTTSSPFVVNHRPSFSVYTDDSPKNPAQLVTWSTTASDADTYEGGDSDTVKLFVCKAADFTGSDCGVGGTWATSTFSAADPSATYTLDNPKPDDTYAAYGYVIDAHGGHASVGAAQGTDSVLVVSNVTPTIAAASVSLLDTDGAGPLNLTSTAGQTTGFSVQYTVTDQNSCSTTAAFGSEIIYGLPDVYRSGVTQASCDQSNEYDPNSCYTGTVATTTWNYSCTQQASSCLGPTDSDVVWTCTFPLWYVAQSTDGTGVSTDPQFWAQNWLASTQSADDDYATSSLVEATAGNELNSFLAYNVATSSIAYGGWQPGQDTGTVGNTALDRTPLQAVGNVGLDETLYGEHMCPTYPSCSGLPQSQIDVSNQKYATSSISYAAATALTASTSPVTYEIHVPKSTSTTEAAYGTTYWGIGVPSAITLSGDYIGVNTLIGVTSPSIAW
ncbi:MAG: hypothetical protein UY81_C0006G0010 [Candidatus Giovannonibacteria bacterium GW2011_GWA2_53_7]|uniref:Uncharacterized protein n=1 Tax=Candidatus Giovannonibacteria bacterium GW2011_GWA2_53_7 TaxID=1618650 RepID=A0A0G1Y1D0_9BACT|nr:MAG: hypothetical protein UY81_C0006G0010 [Candidatus Giovannonibacteria bacterium GW2011_GWA2_53_7]